MNWKWNAGALLLAVVALSAPCRGQVYQKNYQTNPGQVLDKSPQLGTGGYNGGVGASNVGAYGNMARDSSLLVTGQTTGLGNFRGRLPYTPSDQFQGSLPSASLSSFMGRSVGVQDVLRGNTLAPAPYFDASRTILKASAIVGGYASPGTNAPLVPTVDASVRATLRSPTYTGLLAEYKSVLPNAAGRDLSVAMQQVSPSLAAPSALEGMMTGVTPQEYVRIMEGAVPGRGMLLELINERDRALLGQQFHDFLRAQRSGEANAFGSLGINVRSEPDYAIPQIDPNSYRVGGSSLGRPGDANAALAPPRENMDAFMDLLEGMRRKRDGAGAAAPGLPGMPGRLPGTNLPLANEGRSGLVEITPENQILIHNLAGRGRDLANRNMAEAGAKLKAGKYYEAAEAYEMAGSLNLRNPLPRVGQGLAMLGAGEPVSAARGILAAMEVFPPLMEARLDLGSLMNPNVARSRLAELDTRLQTPEEDRDPLLPFLACYLHYNQGDLANAKVYAKQVREGALKSKAAKAFAELVLTGKRPLAQTQPASAPAIPAPA